MHRFQERFVLRAILTLTIGCNAKSRGLAAQSIASALRISSLCACAWMEPANRPASLTAIAVPMRANLFIAKEFFNAD
jgi:hypothetical protein